MMNDKRIKSCLLRFDSGAYSRYQFLRAVSHSDGAHTESVQPPRDNSGNSSSSEDEDDNKQAPVPAASTSGASESATAAAATTSDDCCEVCIVAPRAGFALVPCVGISKTERNETKNLKSMSSSYNTPCSKHKLVVTIYSNTETSLAMSTLVIWRLIVHPLDVRSRVFSRPQITSALPLVTINVNKL